MVCAPVRSIIPSLKLGDFLSVQAHKPCSISHLSFSLAISGFNPLSYGNLTIMLELISSLLTLRTLLVGVVTGLCVYWVMKKFKYRLAPGPFALPLIGNFLRKYYI